MYNNFPCCVIIMMNPDIAWKSHMKRASFVVASSWK